VRVNCGDHACVTLFSPSIWFCGTWFAKALQGHAQVGAVDAAAAKRAADAIEVALKPVPVDPFTRQTLELDTPQAQAHVFEADDES